MVRWELAQHPELRELIEHLRGEDAVVICDHGEPVAAVRRTGASEADLFGFLNQMESPVYPGNSVVDFRREDSR